MKILPLITELFSHCYIMENPYILRESVLQTVGLELERLKCLPGIEEVIKDAIKWHYGKFRTQSILDYILLSTSQDIAPSTALILTISLSMCLSSLKSSTGYRQYI